MAVGGNSTATDGAASSRQAADVSGMDPHSDEATQLRREKFLPVTRHALLDRLSDTRLWMGEEGRWARRFMRYLDYWRRHSYAMKLLELEQNYEPFNPDSDQLHTRAFTADERAVMQKRLVEQVAQLVTQGNFTRVDPSNMHFILTKESAYGLDLDVDLGAFEEVLIYYRGATTLTERHRDIKKGYLGWKNVKRPVFQRLFLLFKLKPYGVFVEEVMRERGLPRKEAEKIVRHQRGMLPETVSSDNVYLKLFKNLPRSDVEMVFPNTKIRFRLFDKIKFGVTASGGLGAGAVGTATKIAVASNPYTLLAAVAGLGGIAIRQASNFINQRNRYMFVLAQNLYFHAMADNRGVMTLMADQAAEEDVKEEMLLYSVLAKERVKIARPAPCRRGHRGLPQGRARHRRGFRRGGCAGAPVGGWRRHAAAGWDLADPAAAAGRPADRQAVGHVPRQPPRHGGRGGPGDGAPRPSAGQKRRGGLSGPLQGFRQSRLWGLLRAAQAQWKGDVPV